MRKRFFGGAILLLLMGSAAAQELKQTVQGRVLDADTQQPLPGVNVLLLGSSPPVGSVSDMEGFYELASVPMGRHSFQFSFLGYEQAVYREVDVRSGRAFVLNVGLKEALRELDEVVVKPQYRKDRAQNTMAGLSARSFSVEEAGRFAGGWNDPARLAGSFAGVTMAEGVNDNAIVIRGNAPKGILWRLEGVEIPAPNHLNGVNNGGGIETVFSVHMLDNSDFYTGAFPAEFGNALSGVFDMQLRNGNSDRLGGTFQVGTQGIDVGAEGPFKQGGEATFLFNYRYATMGLVGLLVDGNFGLPAYQDLSYKLHLPTPSAGTFSLWGIAGNSSVAFDPEEDVSKWTNTFDNHQYETGSDMVATGLTHQVNVGLRTYVQSSLAYSYDGFSMDSKQWQRDGGTVPLADHREQNNRVIVGSTLHHKFGNRHTNRTGVRYLTTDYRIMVRGNPDAGEERDLVLVADQSGTTGQAHFFSQSKWRLRATVDLLAGFSAAYFGMNEELVMEPRLSATWRFAPHHAVSLSYGRHSRPEPLRFYEAHNAQNELLNRHLKVTKADHFVGAYDFRLSPNLKLKVEGYYQKLYDVPVIDGTSYSLLNYKWDDYFEEALTNAGTGSNVGVDVTLERYMTQGYYYQLTASVFDSKYVGGDGVKRHTSFNRNYVINLLGGKEWAVRTNNTIGVNAKVAYMGGNRFTPPDQAASAEHEMVVLDEDRAYAWQEDPRLFMDLALSYKINRPKTGHILTLQAKNLLGQKEMFGWAYDFNQQKVVTHGLTMIYPYFTYRVEF